MGTLLDKPETTKESKEDNGNGIQYGACSMQGNLEIQFLFDFKFKFVILKYILYF